MIAGKWERGERMSRRSTPDGSTVARVTRLESGMFESWIYCIHRVEWASLSEAEVACDSALVLRGYVLEDE